MIEKIKALNAWVALHLMALVSTMSCVYIFTVWSLLPLVYPSSQAFVFYVSGGILQLVFLPAILVGGNILSEKTEARAEADHEAVMEIVQDIHGMMTEETTIDTDICQIKDRLASIEILLRRLP